MRRIGIMIGSDSDLNQCIPGFEYLKRQVDIVDADVVKVITNSIHRNTQETLGNLAEYSPLVDVWIVGAGMANHLTGTVDAYLRYRMGDDRVSVIGVAFEGKTEEDTQAAILSIKKVPGTQVIFNDDYVGSNGFLLACTRAMEGNFPKIKLSDPKPVRIRTLWQAIGTAESMTKEVK